VPTLSRSRSSRPNPETSRSVSSTGTRDRPTPAWDLPPVKLRVTGSVALDDAFVESTLDEKTLASATLRIGATLTNHEDRPVEVSLGGRLGEAAFTRVVALEAGSKGGSVSRPTRFPSSVSNPPPVVAERPGRAAALPLVLEANAGGAVSDRQEVSFGVRSVSDYFNEQGYRGYRVNGKPVLIKGGGWSTISSCARTRRGWRPNSPMPGT